MLRRFFASAGIAAPFLLALHCSPSAEAPIPVPPVDAGSDATVVPVDDGGPGPLPDVSLPPPDVAEASPPPPPPACTRFAVDAGCTSREAGVAAPPAQPDRTFCAKRFGDRGEQRITSVRIDAAGNTTVAGTFDGVIDLGGGP